MVVSLATECTHDWSPVDVEHEDLVLRELRVRHVVGAASQWGPEWMQVARCRTNLYLNTVTVTLSTRHAMAICGPAHCRLDLAGTAMRRMIQSEPQIAAYHKYTT